MLLGCIRHHQRSQQAALHHSELTLDPLNPPHRQASMQQSAAGTFFASKMLNEETMSCEANRLDMFAFSIVTKGLATCSWKVVMFSVVISMLVVSSISSFASISSNTQFAAGNVTLSSVLRVASTRGVITVRSILSAWRALLNLETYGRA